MHELTPVLERLLDGDRLDEAEAAALLERLTDENQPPVMVSAILAAMRVRGESADEVRGLARAMRSLARRPRIDGGDQTVARPSIDIVGTGGDGSGSINISTGVALLSAAIGLRVVKHGNRSISSRSGSADVLEALGLPMPLDEDDAGEVLRKTNFTFLFAPHYHPAMKTLAPIRRAMAVRTVFNILGPLTNPAEPEYHLLGAYSSEVAKLMAEALAGLPIERAFVVHGAEGWDEATPIGPFQLFDVRPGRVEEEVRDPADLSLPRCTADDLRGADAEDNAEAIRAIFGGAPGAGRDTLLLGAALALEVSGEVDSAQEGIERAREAIDSGKATALLHALGEFGRSRSAGQ